MDQHQTSEVADAEVHVNIKFHVTPFFDDSDHSVRQKEGNMAVRPLLQHIKIRHGLLDLTLVYRA